MITGKTTTIARVVVRGGILQQRRRHIRLLSLPSSSSSSSSSSSKRRSGTTSSSSSRSNNNNNGFRHRYNNNNNHSTSFTAAATFSSSSSSFRRCREEHAKEQQGLFDRNPFVVSDENDNNDNNNHNHNRCDRPSSTSSSRIDRIIGSYDASLPIEEASTPPSSWYTNQEYFEREIDSVFFSGENNNWIAVDVFFPDDERENNENENEKGAGSYKTGEFCGEPYLLTRPTTSPSSSSDGNGNHILAFSNVCTHGGSCLVGPWTNNNDDNAVVEPGMVGKSVSGCLSSSPSSNKMGKFRCPYHGWEFNIDGKLTKATNIKGIKNFRPKDYSLKQIPVKRIGPIVFLNFGRAASTSEDYDDDDSSSADNFDFNRNKLFERFERNGFRPDLSDMELVETEEYIVECNWKVFCDNYGDGCYHCSYAHVDLAKNIDENNYGTELLTPDLSVQFAPPSCGVVDDDDDGSGGVRCYDDRFGTRTAVYAQLYPNVMMNRYGPWFDIDLVKPVSSNRCSVTKYWFLEKDYRNDDHRDDDSSYVRESLISSRKIHDEDVFLCENVQRGLNSRNGYDRGRYVPTKQIAAYHFHQKLYRNMTKKGV